MTDAASGLDRTVNSFNRLSAELVKGYRRLEERAERLERQLEQSRSEKLQLADRLSVLLDSLPGAVVVLDREGRVRQANKAADEWFGANVTGARWQRLLRAQGLETAADAHELEFDDGRTVSVSRSRVPGREETIVLLTDITVHRRLQAELERNHRLAIMGEMVARVAHQFRTPLSAALLYASQLESGDPGENERRRWIRKITDRLRRLERTTTEMLGFVRAPVPSEARFSLETLVRGIRELLSETGPDNVRFDCFLDPAFGDWKVLLRGNCNALCGAIGNLVENSWQAGSDRTELKIVPSEAGDGFIDLVIADNGSGIPPDHQDRIFEPFFSEREGGTGLGLPVARSAFEAHGGRLQLGETGAGGTVFIARLPAGTADTSGVRISGEASA